MPAPMTAQPPLVVALFHARYNRGMKDDPKTQTRGHLAAVACAAVLLPILYVLTLGPYVWLAETGYLNQATVDAT